MNSFIEGRVILIDKPYKWTSFSAVNKVKWLIKTGMKNEELKIKNSNSADTRLTTPSFSKLKVGHAGTLDPLATGLLIMCTGKFTKRIEEYQGQEKEYTGTFHLGATTPCFDLEQAIDKHFPTEHITAELIHATTKQFIGTIEQIPPIFSALKINGDRAYDLAREGKLPEMKSRPVTISAFEITNIQMPYADFRVVCSKGTYIRSLARDFGIALNSGAYLTALCRTRIGEFRLKDALNIEAFEKSLSNEI